jgi:hypothetical protein
MLDNEKRWTMTVIYRGEVGPVVVDHDIEEISEAHGIIERGPDWNAILDISIQLTRVSEEGVTLQSPLQENQPSKED